MKCQHCGDEVANGSAFCTNCGKPVEVLAAAQEAKDDIMLAMEHKDTQTPPPSSASSDKPKGLLTPIVTLIASAAGWLYVLFTNSLEGIKAWFTSSQDMQDSLSDSYNYFGNNSGTGETTGYIIFLVIMVLFTVIGIVGLVMLCKRLGRRFIPRKK